MLEKHTKLKNLKLHHIETNLIAPPLPELVSLALDDVNEDEEEEDEGEENSEEEEDENEEEED